MTIKEVCSDLRTQTKPYISKMSQSNYSNTLRHIEAGLSKQSTIDSFFSKFGYNGSFNEWTKSTQ